MDRHNRRKLISSAYRCSFTRLGLNYYTFYETMYENDSASEKMWEIAREFHVLLGEFLEGRGDISKVNHFRNRLIGNMEIITAYTDCFQIYEYVLNRVERRFVKGEDVRQSVDEFTHSLMEVLACSRDSAIMNSRIQEIMGQLPIRYTKEKFYSLLMERLTVYAGGGKKGFEDVLYMLRTSSMVSLPQNMDADQELYGFLEKLRGVDYRNLDKEQYWECADCLHTASTRLNKWAGFYLLVSDLVNDLYVLLLSCKEALVDSQEEQVFKGLAKGIWEKFEKDDKEPFSDQIDEYLEKLEGIQEDVIERLIFDEDETDEILSKIEKLTSGSSFAKLDETTEPEEPADRKWIEEKGKEFCQELNQLFKTMKKPVVRAVMAKIFSYLPVIFSSTEELRNYIKNSLESCTDFAEREACMEILTWELIEEDALV